MGRHETEDGGTVELPVDQLHDDEDLVLQVSAGGPFETYPITDEVNLGRSSTNDIVIADKSVSSRHAVLRVRPRLEIKDLASRNGVRIHGRRIEPDKFESIALGDLVELGAAFVVVRAAGASARARRMWSHDYFEARVEEECERAARSHAEFAIARFRVPGEHSAPLVDNAFASVFRAIDVIARYADNEYEVLLLETPVERVGPIVSRAGHRIRRSLLCDHPVATAVACYPRDGTDAERLLSRVSAVFRGEDEESIVEGPVAGKQPTLVRTQIDQVADSDLSVLLLGETGVGKDVCAHQIHHSSPRRKQKMLRLNCSAFPEHMLEAELFGYEKGAFTGAARAKPGLLETAHGGTVFIDEIGDMPPAVQVKLLRVIEARRVQRIGALEPTEIDVRFVSATHRDLESLIAVGRFRQDLFFRINGFTIRIPPLRQRLDEIEPLAIAFAREAVERSGYPATPTFSADVLAAFRAYVWPGNIRELRNVVERAVVLARGGNIELEHIPNEKMTMTVLPLPAKRPAEPDPAAPPGADEFDVPQHTQEVPAGRNLRAELDDRERNAIIEALETCAGNQTRAAQLLGISRGTLVARLDKYKIPRPRKGKKSD